MVMYRDFATRKARSLKIVGEVWNEDDGTVALVGEGEEQKLLLLIEELKKGPLFARVDRIETAWKDATGEFSGFGIRYQ